MTNMSYCRFQNTLNDLRDCAEHFEDSDLSENEHKARIEMLYIIKDLAAITPELLRYEREEEEDD